MDALLPRSQHDLDAQGLQHAHLSPAAQPRPARALALRRSFAHAPRLRLSSGEPRPLLARRRARLLARATPGAGRGRSRARRRCVAALAGARRGHPLRLCVRRRLVDGAPAGRAPLRDACARRALASSWRGHRVRVALRARDLRKRDGGHERAAPAGVHRVRALAARQSVATPARARAHRAARDRRARLSIVTYEPAGPRGPRRGVVVHARLGYCTAAAAPTVQSTSHAHAARTLSGLRRSVSQRAPRRALGSGAGDGLVALPCVAR